jgi:hypothetical protein
MKRWRITFSNGDIEETPPEVDKVARSIGGDLLFAYQEMTYGPDKVIATYPMVNIRKWEEIQK